MDSKKQTKKSIYFPTRNSPLLITTTSTTHLELTVIFSNQILQKKDKIASTKAIQKIKRELNKPKNFSWKNKISNTITHEILETIESDLKNNKDILIDAWYIKLEMVNTFKTKIVLVLLYCSLPIAYERLLNRNLEAIAEGNLRKKRLYSQLLGLFFSLYTLSDKSENSIESVDLSQMKETIIKISNHLPDHHSDNEKPIFTFKEMFKKQFTSLCNPLIDNLESLKQPLSIAP